MARSAWVAMSSTSCAGVAGGDRLSDELTKYNGHATLHGLKGLFGQTIVGLAQPTPERHDQAYRDFRMLDHQPAHVWAEHGHHARVLHRLHGRRAQLVLEHRQLAKDVARPEGARA